MTVRGVAIFVGSCLFAVAMGCDQGSSNDARASSSASSASSTAPSPGVVETKAVEGHGVIQGTVTFQGVPPTMTTIPNASCAETHVAIQDESVIVSRDLKLKNVVVYLENAPSTAAAATKAMVLDQVNCRYTPHVLAVQTNQPLTIRSSDATLHNVHYSPDINPPSNFGMTTAGQERTVAFKSAEIIKFSCDVHPWMSAYVAVFDHPFFAVTGENGAYEIKGIPAGSYTLACWQERLGKQQQNVNVADNQIAQADFTYKAP